MEFSIVVANKAHLGDISDLFDQYRQFYGQPSDRAAATEFISARMELGDSTILLAVTETGCAAGFAQLFPSFSSVSMRPIYILNDLFVSPDCRGNGVGEALLNEVAAFATENHAVMVKLATAVDNETAQRLYKRKGYNKITQFDHYTLKC